MTDYEGIEKKLDKKTAQRENKRKPKMNVSGKSIFALQKLIQKNDARLPKRRNPKKDS